MRVLEASSGNIPTMGKKKHKLRKKHQELIEGSDSSDESNIHIASSESSCPHIVKAVNFNVVKKYLKQEESIGICSSCLKNGPQAPNNVTQLSENESIETKNTLSDTQIWICLQCGHQGCGRYSPEKHALAHYQTPRSSAHSLALNLHTWGAWCYDCDNDIEVSESRRLRECVEYLKKQKPSNTVINAINQESEVFIKGGVENDRLTPGKESKPVDYIKPKSSQSCSSLPKLKGLNNLGNTCFLNAVLQNLCQTHLLETLLNEKGQSGTVVKLPHRRDSKDNIYCKEDNSKNNLEAINVQLCESGPLTQSMSGFIREMNCTAKNGTISPNKLFGQVCKKAPRFKGFQQQDSHELLRHLLDGINAEEIKRVQAGILKVFQLSTNTNPNKVEDELKSKIKDYWKYAKRTYIDSIFGGYFLSSVICEECHKPSQIIESFQDVSLPISEDKPTRPSNSWNFKKKENAGSLNKDDKKSSDNTFLSKHLLKKSKKAARQEAKKLSKKGAKETSPPKAESSKDDSNDNVSSNDGKTAESEGTNSISEKYDDYPNVEEEEHSKSDGDVEDNEESDASKLSGSFMNAQSNDTDKDSMKDSCSSLNLKDLNSNDITDDSSLKDSITIQMNNLHLENNEVLTSDVVTSDFSMLTENSSVSSFKSSYFTDSNSDIPKNDIDSSSKLTKMDEIKIFAMNSLVPKYQPLDHECSLQTCLNQFTSAELLTGSNKFGCENCTRDKYGSQTSLEDKKDVYTNASKQVLIFKPPAVITFHLKRFQQVGFSLRKVNRHVSFPLVLDIAPYCSSLCDDVTNGKKKVLYSLYGVVEHSGKLCGGHYTAYVKVRQSQTNLKEFLQHNPLMTENLNSILKFLYEQQGQINVEEEETIPVNSSDQNKPGKWYYISDSRVTESSEAVVLKCQAYILFYERIC